MAKPTRSEIVERLLAEHGQTFASEAGIRLARATPSPLFRLLCLSILISARIRADAAMAAARAMADAGWTTAKKLAESSWQDRTRVLNRAGYARYDESTSRYLGETATLALDRYGGDLRHARADADGDVFSLQSALKECRGVGDVGASFFVREVQAVWSELAPFLDERASRSAEQLGLPADAAALRRLVDDTETFVRLVAALVRVSLSDTHDHVLRTAGR